MTKLESIHFTSRKAFRQWLHENHDNNSGIWMIFFKKHVNHTGITHEEVIEEAICYGWIDSIIKKIDTEKYVIKFTPRKNHKN
jgi:uncharacterized protein YdeI (YjbR/CyaY-like superfamily)